MNTTRDPQLALRLDGATPDPAVRWHDGAALPYLGGSLRICLDTLVKDAVLDGTVLHLPLPPQATPRQIQDRAEAWLREAAKRLLTQMLAQKSAQIGRRAPRLALSFAAHGNWAEVRDADTLRCNWRLIEQAPDIVEQVLSRALAALPKAEHEADLFGAFA